MITIRFYGRSPRPRIRVTGHASKWVCGAVTMFVQACAGFTADDKAFYRGGTSDVAIPNERGARRFVRWTLEALAREMPTEVRIVRGAPIRRKKT